MSISGVNLDIFHPLGKPSPAALSGFKYARLLYNVSRGMGSTDLNAAHANYGPYLNALLAAGITPIVVLGHQTWGEGRGFNWEQMSAGDWSRLIEGFTAMVRQIAQLYAGKGIVWQAWNESDAASEAAVGVPAATYGLLFKAAYSAIKAADPSAKVITGGLVSGPGSGKAYFQASGITQTDGIAIHTYGASAGGLYVYPGIDSIGQQLAAWQAPGKPLWITEWGILNRPNEPEAQVAAYARAFTTACAGKVQAAVWYPWADTMHNGYGVARQDGTVREPVKLALTMTTGGGMPSYTPYNPGPHTLSGAAVNLRQTPGGTVVTSVPNGATVEVLSTEVPEQGGYGWQNVRYGGKTGWMALGGSGVTWTLVPVAPVDREAVKAEIHRLVDVLYASG